MKCSNITQINKSSVQENNKGEWINHPEFYLLHVHIIVEIVSNICGLAYNWNCGSINGRVR